MKDDFPRQVLVLSRGKHILSLVIRRMVDGSDADKTDVSFEVTENGLENIDFLPSSEPLFSPPQTQNHR